MMKKTSMSHHIMLTWLLGLFLACSPDSQVSAKGAAPSIPVGDSYATSDASALVTIIEFSDFQCPFCKRVTGTLKQIKETYGNKVRVAFKHNPLPFHKDAPYASQAALAAGKQGKFWEMHDKLFENMKALKPENVAGYAKELGLDMTKFNADVNSDAVKA
jgi:protein-disulfide isomerase